jgi:hypothetical protein
MPEPAQLYLVAILLQATEDEPAELLNPLMPLLATSQSDAEAIGERMVPEQHSARAEVIVRPF